MGFLYRLVFVFVVYVSNCACMSDNATCTQRLGSVEAELEIYKTRVSKLETVVNVVLANDNLIRSGRSVRGVSFTAVLSANTGVAQGETVVFDKVLLNDGHGYDSGTGVFTAPVEGVFLFMFAFKKTASVGQLWLGLMHNGKQVVAGVSDVLRTNEDIQGGNSAVLNLAIADRVWIEAFHVQSSRMHGTMPFSTFTGIWQY